MSKNIIIIGAGGHGKVIADAILCQRMNVIGFLDDDLSVMGQQILDLPVLGQVSQWMNFSPDGLVVGIGNNTIRHTLVQKMEMDSVPPWISVVHPNAFVTSFVQIGVGTVIMAGAIINTDTKLGKHSIINTGATVDHDCVIGDFVHIAPGANLAGNVHVSNGAFLGVGCCVLPGCKISENAIIGAGATVISDIPPGVIAKGVPARWIK
jgi:sugar O-acyltransferase (sialic acid O-acetyltransferase NeuD family)